MYSASEDFLLIIWARNLFVSRTNTILTGIILQRKTGIRIRIYIFLRMISKMNFYFGVRFYLGGGA